MKLKASEALVPMMVSLEKLIVDIRRTCAQRECSPSEAVLPEDLDLLSNSDLRKCAMIGLIKIVSDNWHSERRSIASQNGRHFTADGRNPSTRYDALSIEMSGAGGRIKALSVFTQEDCEALKNMAAKMEIGWRKRKDWAVRAQHLLQNSPRALNISKLKKEQVSELRDLAAKAWL